MRLLRSALLGLLSLSSAVAGGGEEGDSCLAHADCGGEMYCPKSEECALCVDDDEELCTLYRDSIDGSCAPCGEQAARPPQQADGLTTPEPPAERDALAVATGEVVTWDARAFTLKEDGMAILPGALTASQLAELNFLLESLLANLEASAAVLDPSVLEANAARLSEARDQVDSHNGFCFGDITQRGPGKYEIRVPELDLYPPPPPPITAKRPWVPPAPLFPSYLDLKESPPWREAILQALGSVLHKNMKILEQKVKILQ